MIVAAGLSPAWQQILLFDDFAVGQVNRAQSVAWCASGKVVNVAVALHHLRADCRMLTLVGGDFGAKIQIELAGFGLSARWIESLAPTRVCTTILNHSRQVTTELVENAPAISEDELEAFQRAFHEESANANVVVLSGSLPQGAPANYYSDLLEGISGRAILDIRGPELLALLGRRPFLCKPNREELSRTVGRPLETDADLLAAMREVNARGAEWVIVTQGRGAVFVTSTEASFYLNPPSVPVVNPIGCGDCLAAGVACAVDEGRNMLDAVRWGMAAAAENVSQLLPARVDRIAVEERSRSIEVVEFTDSKFDP